MLNICNINNTIKTVRMDQVFAGSSASKCGSISFQALFHCCFSASISNFCSKLIGENFIYRGTNNVKAFTHAWVTFGASSQWSKNKVRLCFLAKDNLSAMSRLTNIKVLSYFLYSSLLVTTMVLFLRKITGLSFLASRKVGRKVGRTVGSKVTGLS